MNLYLILMLSFITSFTLFCQEIERDDFHRKVLPGKFDAPWEIELANDGYLYLIENPGQISRIHPEIGEKEVLIKFDDFYYSDEREIHPTCALGRQSGIKGMALHPDFTDPDSSYFFCFYSFNSGTEESPTTDFQLVRYKWNEATSKMTEKKVLVEKIPGGYDHSGGRVISVKENGTTYIYFTVGDMGPTDTECWQDSIIHPREQAQNPEKMNGKTHRILIDGRIPEDNPIQGNSFWTRGHRNQQGLTYNPNNNKIYSAEHGATTDDEINILEKGMNYGWYNVAGFHDGNKFGEIDFIDSYQPHKDIENDRLIEPIYSWCLDSTTDIWWLSCTVAPSDLEYYNYNAIPGWQNSLVVACLKQANFVDRGLRVVKLSEDGLEVIEPTTSDQHSLLFFEEDHLENGRLRDLEFSKDGKSIYLINNFGDKGYDQGVIVYTYSPFGNVFEEIEQVIYPNPAKDILYMGSSEFENIKIHNILGNELIDIQRPGNSIDISKLKAGTYFAEIIFEDKSKIIKFIKN